MIIIMTLRNLQNMPFFEMDGKALSRITAAYFRGFVGDLLDKAGWTLDGVDLVIPH